MYRVYYGNRLLYDPRSEDEQLINIRLSVRVNEAAELTFVQPSTNPIGLEQLSEEVVVKNEGKEVFRGKITKISSKDSLTKSVTARSALNYLNNAQIRPFDTLKTPSLIGKAPSDFLRWIVEQYNEQCTPSISIGRNEVDQLWGGGVFVRSSERNMSAAECIKEKLLGMGGYVEMTNRGGEYFLDFFSDFREVSEQVIEFGENLLRFAEDSDASKVYTACLPYGETDQDTEQRLDISSLPDLVHGDYRKQGDAIINIPAAKRYGVRYCSFEDTELTTPLGVLEAGMRHIGSVCAPVQSLKLTALDLSLVEKVSPIELFSYVRCKAKPYGFDALMVATEAKIDISNPRNTSYTLGAPPERMTGGTLKRLPSVISAVDEVIVQVPSISQEAKQAAEAAQRAETAADGKSRNYITQEDPTASETIKPGDTWYNPLTRQSYVYEEI